MQSVSPAAAHLARLAVVALVVLFLASSLAFGQEPAAAPVDPVTAALPAGSPWWAGSVLAVVGSVVAAARWGAGLVERRLAADDALRVEYRRGVDDRLRAIEARLARLDTEAALARQAIVHVSATLRAAADD